MDDSIDESTFRVSDCSGNNNRSR